MWTRRGLLRAAASVLGVSMAGETVLPARVPTAPLVAGAIASPFQFVLNGSENLQVVAACSATGATVTIHARFLLKDGSINPQSFGFDVPGDRSLVTKTFPVGAGTLLTLVAFEGNGVAVYGECYVRASIIQGLGGATLLMGTLAAGYVTLTQPIAWPSSQLERSTDGPGATKVIPFVGAALPALALTVPAGARWRFRLVDFFYNSTGGAGVFVWMRFTIGGQTLHQFLFIASLPAGISGLAAGDGMLTQGTTAALGWQTLEIPSLLLPAGSSLSIVAPAAALGDSIAQGTAIVQEWLEV